VSRYGDADDEENNSRNEAFHGMPVPKFWIIHPNPSEENADIDIVATRSHCATNPNIPKERVDNFVGYGYPENQ
jgi:hypothetical protein